MNKRQNTRDQPTVGKKAIAKRRKNNTSKRLSQRKPFPSCWDTAMIEFQPEETAHQTWDMARKETAREIEREMRLNEIYKTNRGSASTGVLSPSKASQQTRQNKKESTFRPLASARRRRMYSSERWPQPPFRIPAMSKASQQTRPNEKETPGRRRRMYSSERWPQYPEKRMTMSELYSSKRWPQSVFPISPTLSDFHNRDQQVVAGGESSSQRPETLCPSHTMSESDSSESFYRPLSPTMSEFHASPPSPTKSDLEEYNDVILDPGLFSEAVGDKRVATPASPWEYMFLEEPELASGSSVELPFEEGKNGVATSYKKEKKNDDDKKPNRESGRHAGRTKTNERDSDPTEDEDLFIWKSKKGFASFMHNFFNNVEVCPVRLEERKKNKIYHFEAKWTPKSQKRTYRAKAMKSKAHEAAREAVNNLLTSVFKFRPLDERLRTIIGESVPEDEREILENDFDEAVKRIEEVAHWYAGAAKENGESEQKQDKETPPSTDSAARADSTKTNKSDSDPDVDGSNWKSKKGFASFMHNFFNNVEVCPVRLEERKKNKIYHFEAKWTPKSQKRTYRAKAMKSEAHEAAREAVNNLLTSVFKFRPLDERLRTIIGESVPEGEREVLEKDFDEAVKRIEEVAHSYAEVAGKRDDKNDKSKTWQGEENPVGQTNKFISAPYP